MADDVLNSPEMLDWIRCHEQAVEIIKGVFSVAGAVPTAVELNARACLARMATAGITVAWNRDD